ncbi:hypothetical protein [Yersinia alsatica]|uniref:hypothetical protein n=1 Tax=Yersinia alsatica TaxID=2890317 RepID=UPI0011A19109|nr:hypothetical protein [Yersinia alsatica]
MKHQQQPTYNTCMSACVAMVASIPVEDAVNRWHDGFHQKSEWLDDALDFYKIPYFYGHPKRGELLYGFIYFLSVPSLNITGGLHEILISLPSEGNIKVFDPAMGRENAKYYVYGKPNSEVEVELTSLAIDLAIPALTAGGGE